MLIGEPALLGDALRGQQVAQPLDIEVGQTRGHAPALGEVPLRKRPALPDGRENLQIPLDVSVPCQV